MTIKWFPSITPVLILLPGIVSFARGNDPLYQPGFQWVAPSKEKQSKYPYKIHIIRLTTNLELIENKNDWRFYFYQQFDKSEFRARVNTALRDFFRAKGFEVVEKGYPGNDAIKISLNINWILSGYSIPNGPTTSSTGQRYYPFPTKEEYAFKFAIYDSVNGLDVESITPFVNNRNSMDIRRNNLTILPTQTISYSRSEFSGGFFKSLTTAGFTELKDIALFPYFYKTNFQILENSTTGYFNHLWREWGQGDIEKWLPDPGQKMKEQKPIDAD